jgi:hypothetical protein
VIKVSLKKLKLINEQKGLYYKHWIAEVDKLPECSICKKEIKNNESCFISDFRNKNNFCCKKCVYIGSVESDIIPKTHKHGKDDYLVWIKLIVPKTEEKDRAS